MINCRPHERVLVDIGMGFYLECDRDDALKVIDSRISFLNEKVLVYKKSSISIKAQIKLLLEVSLF